MLKQVMALSVTSKPTEYFLMEHVLVQLLREINNTDYMNEALNMLLCLVHDLVHIHIRIVALIIRVKYDMFATCYSTHFT